MEIKVGCCGFAGGIKNYFKNFDLVEVQQTFYKIPQNKTLEKWKRFSEQNKNFEFAIKCFQGVTHDYKSPTWKKFGEIKGKKENYGFLKNTKEVFDSWKKTLDAARILNSKIILIQLPSSFKDDEENLKNAENFFRKVKKDVEIVFEPRGWKKDSIRKICKKFGIVHCVDILKELPAYYKKFVYFRLHGKYKNGRIDYNHKYEKEELEKIKEEIFNLNVKKAYVLFNNIFMKEDASKFKKIIA